MRFAFIKLSCAVMIFYSAQAQAITQVDVDVELQLLIDISGSIDSNEYDLQMLGYANAFKSDDVQNAIINGTEGKIAVQLIMWSGASSQQVMIDWSLIDSAESADILSDEIANIARPFSGMTAIGSAVEYSYQLFEENGFNGTSQVIDISGDGTNNSGSSPSSATQIALDSGVDTINGIVITSDNNVIEQYYNEVIGGDSAFLLSPATFDDFQLSIENKIVAEIEGTRPAGAVAIPEPSSFALFIISFTLIGFRQYLHLKEKAHETS